jgi:mRNA interferase MazF
MTCRRGDLVLVPFPFTDLSTEKRRPVLCLTDADGFGDFLAAAVTTKGHHTHALSLDALAMAQGRLPVTSWVRVDRLITLSQSLVSKTFGAVTPEFLSGVIAKACERIGIVPPGPAERPGEGER